MRILILKHVFFEGPGAIAPLLEELGHELSIKNAWELKSEKDFYLVNEYDGLVLMGGPMAVYEKDCLFIQQEIPAIKNYIANNSGPVLGVCLGAQVIAKALGAEVASSGKKEIGFFPVEAVETNNKNFLSFPSFTPLHWHGDLFAIPEGSAQLYKSKMFDEQAFLYRDNILGLQFHLEVDKAQLEALLEHCGDELAEAQQVNENATQTALAMRQSLEDKAAENLKVLKTCLNHLFPKLNE